MGTGAEFWIPMLLSAGGAGVGAINARNVAKEQDRIAAAGIAKQAARDREARALVDQELGGMERSSPEGERDAALAEFTNALTAARAGQMGGADTVQGSNRFQTEAAAGRESVLDYGKRLADIRARMVAPGRQREREAFSRARAGSAIEGVARNAQGDAFLTDLLSRSVRPNTGLSILGPVLTGAGSAMAGRAGAIPSNAEVEGWVNSSMADVMRKMKRVPLTVG